MNMQLTLQQIKSLADATKFPDGEERYLVAHVHAELKGPLGPKVDGNLLVLPIDNMLELMAMQAMIDRYDTTDIEPGDHEIDMAQSGRKEFQPFSVFGFRPKITLVGAAKETVRIMTRAELIATYGEDELPE